MKSDDMQIVATAASRPREIGKEGAELGLQAFSGETPADAHRKLQPKLVTKEQIDSYTGW